MNKELLQTIRANKNLHYLTDRLPKSNYANGHEYEKNPKLSQSTKARNPKDAVMAMHSNPNKNLILPKLDRIVGRNHGKYQVPVLYQHPKDKAYDKKHTDIDVSSLLKI